MITEPTICANCSKPLIKGQERFCSRACSSVFGAAAVIKLHKEREQEFFWNMVDKSGGPDACWPWIGQVTKEGYGVTKRGAKPKGRIASHRFAFSISRHIVTDADVICHKCDNRKCCNPSHLFCGTPADNVHDCIAKGRFPVGERQKLSKLKKDQVILIKSDSRTQIEIARAYGVSQSLVSAIKTGIRWKHV